MGEERNVPKCKKQKREKQVRKRETLHGSREQKEGYSFWLKKAAATLLVPLFLLIFVFLIWNIFVQLGLGVLGFG
jgi:hypothetical protein